MQGSAFYFSSFQSPSSSELEVAPSSPPLIVISDASSDEAAAPPDTPATETA